jgi:hypothetical protein
MKGVKAVGRKENNRFAEIMMMHQPIIGFFGETDQGWQNELSN